MKSPVNGNSSKKVVDIGQVSYGGLFCRIAGPLESIVARAREKGLCWLRGQKGSRELYKTLEKAA